MLRADFTRIRWPLDGGLIRWSVSMMGDFVREANKSPRLCPQLFAGFSALAAVKTLVTRVATIIYSDGVTTSLGTLQRPAAKSVCREQMRSA